VAVGTSGLEVSVGITEVGGVAETAVVGWGMSVAVGNWVGSDVTVGIAVAAEASEVTEDTAVIAGVAVGKDVAPSRFEREETRSSTRPSTNAPAKTNRKRMAFSKAVRRRT
jgi:hypothetical protein